jgi:XcyI restriction endonuclease
MILPEPELQGAFWALLESARHTVLQSALKEVVGNLPIKDIDAEIHEFVDPNCISRLASRGLRAELMFPLPIILRSQPSILAYYRLLFGYSQKQFYSSGSGRGIFKRMEFSGKMSPRADVALPQLCETFASSGLRLLRDIPDGWISATALHDLSLLTFGAQLRGGTNNLIGSAGIKAVFELIGNILSADVKTHGQAELVVVNAAKNEMTIAVAADPDIVIRSSLRKIVAIEVKAGTDHSNIHNRVGEAEKSHQKARASGFTECWTVINVAGVQDSVLKSESPSTDRFYRMMDILDPDTAVFIDFSRRIKELVGV